jgi:hypothetical protein
MRRSQRRGRPGAKRGRSPVHDPCGSRHERYRLGVVTSCRPPRPHIAAGHKRPLDTVREKGSWVRPAETIRACSDPDDDIFIECAAAAQADYLVTGNLRHFPSSWMKTRIVTARFFLDAMSEDAVPDQP